MSVSCMESVWVVLADVNFTTIQFLLVCFIEEVVWELF